MSISIRITSPSEAEELSQIQKEAFKPLYDKYHIVYTNHVGKIVYEDEYQVGVIDP